MSNELIKTRAKLEKIVFDGLDHFGSSADALTEIKTRKMWKIDHESFEAYASNVFGFTKSWAYRIIKARSTMKLLGADEISISAAGPLGSVPKSEQKKLYKDAKSLAGSKGITKGNVQKAKEKRTDKKAKLNALDCLEQPIQHDYIKTAFRETPTLMMCVSAVGKVRKSVVEMCDELSVGVHVHLQQIETDLKNVGSALRFGRPHAICPWCKGERCENCRNSGWVPKEIYDRADEDLK